MALVVEDGSGVAGANTYADEVYVDAYCAGLGLAEWAAKTAEEKESAILRAMQYIESRAWKGAKAEELYPLEWPRAAVEDRNGFAIDEDEIPENVKKALAEAAHREADSPRGLQKDLKGSPQVKRSKAGSLETEFFAGTEEAGARLVLIEALLVGLVVEDTAVLRT